MPIHDLLHTKRYVAPEVKGRRLKICSTCPQKTTLNRCRACGCFLGLKTSLKTEKCPIGKWEQVVTY